MSRPGKPTTFPPDWLPLVERAGGVQQLAEALHVTRLTVYRWAHRKRGVGGPEAALIATWCRRRRLPLPAVVVEARGITETVERVRGDGWSGTHVAFDPPLSNDPRR